MEMLRGVLSNAVKYTKTGGITIGWRGDALFIEDTGIGIPKEHLARIFEPFYQVESGPNRRFGGTGLGTTIAMECVRRLGGELKVESTLGEGTVATVRLPAQEAKAAA